MNIFERLVALQNQLNYVYGVLARNLEDWERKEYQELANDYRNKIENLHLAIQDYLEVYANNCKKYGA